MKAQNHYGVKETEELRKLSQLIVNRNKLLMSYNIKQSVLDYTQSIRLVSTQLK